MPLFALHAIDRPDALPLRLEHYAAHRAFIETASEHGIVIVLSGPMQSDDGEVMIGSLFVIEAPGREAVESLRQCRSVPPGRRMGRCEDYPFSSPQGLNKPSRKAA